jgi:flagellar protein FliO/FliZ
MPTSLAPLLWFAAIIALIPIALWLLKRTPVGSLGAPGTLRSVAALALSPTQRVMTIEVGEGDQRRWLVLGVTPQSVTLLRDMPPQGDALAPGAVPATPFAQLLGRLRTQGGNGAPR